MNLELAGKRVVIAGGGGAIGTAITQVFIDEGADVFVAHRSNTRSGHGNHPRATSVNLQEAAAPDALVEAASRALGRIDILINNVGPIAPRPGFLGISEQDLETTLALNLLVPWRLCRAVLPKMLAQGSGTIINLASIAALRPVADLAHYGAAKAALVSMTTSLAQEFAPAGSRVTAISPTPVTGAGASPVVRFDYPTGRANQPDEVANLVAVVASPRLGNVTGANYIIDGGLTQTHT